MTRFIPPLLFFPMGFSWLLHTAQRPNEAQLETIPSLGQSRLVRDAHASVWLSTNVTLAVALRGTSVVSYVENLGVRPLMPRPHLR